MDELAQIQAITARLAGRPVVDLAPAVPPPAVSSMPATALTILPSDGR